MTGEPLANEEALDESIDGLRVVEEYEHLKRAIMLDRKHTAQDGRATVVRDSLVIPEGGAVVDKIRGGAVLWEENYLNQPCSRVDDDPRTFDRISLERTIQLDGEHHGTSSIIYSETTELTPKGEERLVVEKLERYSQQTDRGDVTGERFVKVISPSGVVLDHYHHRSKASPEKE